MTSRFVIGIDNISPGESTMPGAPGGMRTYLRELLTRMPALAPEASFVVLTPDWNADFGPLPDTVRLVPVAGVPRSRAARIWFQQTRWRAAVSELNADVFLATATVAPPGARTPVVLAVQFLQFYDYPETYGRARTLYLKLAVPRSVRRARRVIVFTGFQREELRAHMACDAEKIAVVPHGIDHVSLASPAPPADVEALRALTGGRPYVVYVSATYGYKNHLGLIAAFGRLKAAHTLPHALVLVGAEVDVTREQLRAAAADVGVASDVVVAGRLPSVAAAYQAADLCAFPSLYETFGFPALEAMAAGCPLVASDRGATAELCGDGAILADATDAAAFAGAMARALIDRTGRGALVARGRDRAASFTWARSAEQTLAVLRGAAGR
jgi:glycosyltransferase involved in cell wall biosynthesis